MVSPQCLVLFAALTVMGVESVRPGQDNYNLVYPLDSQSEFGKEVIVVPVESSQASRAKRLSISNLIEERNRLADALYQILAANGNGVGQEGIQIKKKRENALFVDQKRQSLRKSNFDILAGGGLGK
uniref:Corticotropin-releasing factor domain-containing protein n=1 Tax=Panagrellus redivivus TaxID=6233 RepID=A0A7E4W7Z8_PANRE